MEKELVEGVRILILLSAYYLQVVRSLLNNCYKYMYIRPSTFKSLNTHSFIFVFPDYRKLLNKSRTNLTSVFVFVVVLDF